jgi:hypothetical protein
VGGREVAEWDWVVLPSWNRLHAPEEWDDPHEEMRDDRGKTVCGRRGPLSIPGVFSRMGLPRCRHCCRMTGMPQGVGSPRNDAACRPLVAQRYRLNA